MALALFHGSAVALIYSSGIHRLGAVSALKKFGTPLGN
jgi:hypothetical protein